MSDSYDDRRRPPGRLTHTTPVPNQRRMAPPQRDFNDDYDVPRTGSAGHDFDDGTRRPVPAPPLGGITHGAGHQQPPQRQGHGPQSLPGGSNLEEAWRETMAADAAAAASPRTGRAKPDYEEYVDDAPPTGTAHGNHSAVRPEEDDLVAPTRQQRSVDNANHPIVPAGSVTGRSLNLVIVIMCFLACLTAGAVYMMNQAATAWLREIASEVTVQVEARDKTDVDKLVRDVTQFLGQQPGIARVRALSLDENMKLTSEWLPQTDTLNTLPVPRLIAVEVDRMSPPDFEAVRKGIAAKFKGVSLDDHRHWQQQIRTVTHSFALGGLAILMLVGAATTAIIVSATRSALSANREIVEVLHFVGATDKFIAREFEKHFLRLGIRAGIIGAVSAMLVFLVLPFAMQFLGGGTVSLAELQRLIGTGALDVSGYVLLLVVVVVISTLCMLTSRIGVYRILNSQH